jgi:hypothetical protein
VTAAPRPAAVRFYVDADLLGLAKLLAGLRVDVTYPGDRGAVIKRRHRPACPITSPRVSDTVWLPTVANAGWLIITRDRHIQDHRAEIAAVRDNAAKMVALAGADAVDTWAQLEIVMSNWRTIELLAEEPGPFIYTATRTSLRPVQLA